MAELTSMRKAFASLLLAATATAQPAFEVASVKANTSGDRSSFSRTGKNSLVLQNWSLQRIILRAYGLKEYALTGPDWLASLSFDINAKAEGPVTEAGLRQMLQALLVERFGLTGHTTVQDRQAYVLLPAKGGFKLNPVSDGLAVTDDCDLSRFPQKTRISCRHCSLDYLAEVLSGQLDSIVVDQSGVRATYAFTLEWSPDLSADGATTSIFSALNEQLGLRLERRKLPLSILVVDRISKTPTDN
jgi:uncharacterized protein (TIGR03435 family)